MSRSCRRDKRMCENANARMQTQTQNSMCPHMLFLPLPGNAYGVFANMNDTRWVFVNCIKVLTSSLDNLQKVSAGMRREAGNTGCIFPVRLDEYIREEKRRECGPSQPTRGADISSTTLAPQFRAPRPGKFTGAIYASASSSVVWSSLI